MTTQTDNTTAKVTCKSSMTIERLLDHRYKATLGQAHGVGKSETKARAACEAQVVDIVQNNDTPRMEVRDGYLIVSQVQSSLSSWYSIKKLGGLVDGRIYPSCFLHPKHLRKAIETHLAQYLQDDIAQRSQP